MIYSDDAGDSERAEGQVTFSSSGKLFILSAHDCGDPWPQKPLTDQPLLIGLKRLDVVHGYL